MPANIESMFSVREMPWHRQGQVLTDYPGTWTAARTLAGLDWEPVTEPVYAAVGINEDGTPHYAPIEGWKRISRSDTGTTLSLNRDTYRLIDHTEMGEIIEAVLAQPNVKWETAGVLDEGRAVWCLAKLDEPIELPGDDSLTLPYLAITNRHDGSGACALRATAVRIVCANTFRAAELEGSGHGATFAFVHKGRWRDRIDEARQAVTGARREIRRYQQLAHDLLPRHPTGWSATGSPATSRRPAKRCGSSSSPAPPHRSPTPPTASSRPPASTSTTSAAPAPGRPGSTAPSCAPNHSKPRPWPSSARSPAPGDTRTLPEPSAPGRKRRKGRVPKLRKETIRQPCPHLRVPPYGTSTSPSRQTPAPPSATWWRTQSSYAPTTARPAAST